MLTEKREAEFLHVFVSLFYTLPFLYHAGTDLLTQVLLEKDRIPLSFHKCANIIQTQYNVNEMSFVTFLLFLPHQVKYLLWKTFLSLGYFF